MWPFHFCRRGISFLDWVRLKGAVPITLATFPRLAGMPKSGQVFTAVFFMVLISALSPAVVAGDDQRGPRLHCA